VSERLTHLNARGEAHIVDIGNKPVTARRAVARAVLEAEPATIDAVVGGTLKKGDALAVARIAGIMAAKRTSELIPLCHQINLSKVDVKIEFNDSGIFLEAEAKTASQTGVEMEAMTAASVAALTLYDMAKGMDRAMRVTAIELMEKSGGKSEDFRR
jgi:cyclic pyranopterin phosphate synthase